MKINYPVKYAAMPMVEQKGWSIGANELERDYGTACYIVSKCYLISESKIYKENGSNATEYEIVFPYQKKEYSLYERCVPKFNLIHGYCINSTKTEIVFDSYEDALAYTNSLNGELLKKSYVYLPYSKDFMKKVQEKIDGFNGKLEEYKALEQQILENTKDIDNTNIKLSNVIRKEDNTVKLINTNIYDVLKLYENETFLICSISDEVYNNIITKDNIVNIDKVHIEGMLLHENSNDLVNITKDIKSNLVFYTTESTEDLLMMNKTYPEIDFYEIKEKVLKRTQ